MTEQELISFIRNRLDEGSQQIDGITLRRLEEARHRALSGSRAAERQLVAAGSHASGRNGQLTLGLGQGSGAHPHHLRVLFVGLALIALMAGTAYWQQANDDDSDTEQGLLDAKMLSSELPLYTFLHPDFKQWVDNSH